MIENLNNLSFCSSRALCNNIELFIYEKPSSESNQINFACINLLLNNLRNIETLLLLKIEVLESILMTIPSQMRTLLCLDNFNKKLEQSLQLNPAGLMQYELIKKFDYKKHSAALNQVVITEYQTKPQMTFCF